MGRRGPGQGTMWTSGTSTWIRWVQDGKRKTRRFPGTDRTTRDTAKRVLAKIARDLAAGVYVDVDPSPPPSPVAPTLGELGKEWMAEREATNRAQPTKQRAWRTGRNAWNRHVVPALGALPVDKIDQAAVHDFALAKVTEGLNPATVGGLVQLLSAFYKYAIRKKATTVNPARDRDDETKAITKPTHDPRSTPFLEDQADIARLYRALPAPYSVIYAVSALAGLRPGEVYALEWTDVDLDRRIIKVERQVRHGRVGVPKGGRPRDVPIIAALGKILAEWRLKTGGAGLVFKPNTNRKTKQHVKGATVLEKLRAALEACGLPETLTLYEVGRHTFASQFILNGGSMAILSAILGHSSVTITERNYVHHRPDRFAPDQLLKLTVDMDAPAGQVVDIGTARAARRSHTGATTEDVSPAAGGSTRT